eukprot:TRINITY_DN164059_c1_g1_i2.p1 TRINITY_DN164059_c1_g1~~TRINITY_DN164059_c1_g1_i2.p1  ORF type:complete len:556 (+),score=156.51 TRINITY_DN164059_c1_g1_i2:62-1729(+)
MTDFQIDQKVCDKNGYCGIVKYIGPVVASSKADAIYIGVEWNDGARGKHRRGISKSKSTGEEKVYFECEEGHSCSFMKPSTLMGTNTLVKALISRYEDVHESKSEALVTNKGDEVEVEFVGENKIKSLQRLTNLQTISAEDMCIDSCGSELGELCPNVRDLNLKRNLVTSWKEVMLIAGSLPKLEVLDLSYNKLEPFSVFLTESGVSLEEFGSAFGNLRALILNDTFMTWKEATLVCKGITQLKEFYFSRNDLEELDSCVDCFPSLELMDISINKINNWDEIWKLRDLKKLSQLLLNENEISEIQYGEEHKTGILNLTTEFNDESPFLRLESLSLARNKIDSWRSVDMLNMFPSLVSTRLQFNPIFESVSYSVGRLNAVSRVANLASLNNSMVRHRERLDCETYVLKDLTRDLATKYDCDTVMEALAKAGDKGRKEILLEFPRFEQLLDKHGPPVLTDRARQVDANKLVITVTVRSNAAQSCTMEPVQKRLPLSMNIERIKVMFQRTFKVPASSQKLFFNDKTCIVPIPLDRDNQNLSYFGVSDGAEIIIENADE